MINEDPIIIIKYLQVYGKSWNNPEQVIAKSFIRNVSVYSKSFISLCRHYELMIYNPLWSDWSCTGADNGVISLRAVFSLLAARSARHGHIRGFI